MKKAIVLGADNGYMDKVETTIKSVCAHNHNIKFYIFNDDLPSDWFRIMNFRLKANHSEIVNVKISDHTLKNYRLAISYLSYAAFFRYFIGEFVEEDRAIYLDSDIIVTSCLDELFNIDLEDYWLAGVADYFDGDYTGGFNSGMMVIPVKKWKESDIANQLLQLTEQEIPHSIAVVIDRIEKQPGKKKNIIATIVVERKSQKIEKQTPLQKRVNTSLSSSQMVQETLLKTLPDTQSMEVLAPELKPLPGKQRRAMNRSLSWIMEQEQGKDTLPYSKK